MKFKKDIIIFIGIYAIIVIIAVKGFIFPDFDWFNYKLYNCWAFLTDRISSDFFVGNFRTCFNPMIDLPEYFLLWKLNSHPYLFSVICALDSVLFLFLVYKITEDFFSKIIEETKNNYLLKLIKFFPLIYIMFMPVLFYQTCFDQNDIKIGLLILSAFFIFEENIFKEQSRKRNLLIFLSGCIVGIATGLKLTACIYAISFCLIMLILLKKIQNPIKTLILFCFGIVLMFFATDGFWLAKCYQTYKNPFFPYFNNIFKSEFAATIELLNQDYYHLQPHSVKEFIFYPFLVSFSDRLYGTDQFSWDARYAINFILSIITLILAVKSKYSDKIKSHFNSFINYDLFILFVLFSIVPFYVNLVLLGTYRYITASGALYGIILFTFIFAICKFSKNKEIFASILSLIFLLYAYISSDYGNLEFIKNYEENPKSAYSKIYEIKDFKFEDNSVVIVLNAGSSAALVTQNPNVKYIGSVLPYDIFKKEEDVFKSFDLWYRTKNLKSDYIEKNVSDIIASDKKIYVVILQNDDRRIAKEGLFYLDKKSERRLENCEDAGLKIFNSTFWNTEIVKCEFNKK